MSFNGGSVVRTPPSEIVIDSGTYFMLSNAFLNFTYSMCHHEVVMYGLRACEKSRPSKSQARFNHENDFE